MLIAPVLGLQKMMDYALTACVDDSPLARRVVTWELQATLLLVGKGRGRPQIAIPMALSALLGAQKMAKCPECP